MRDDPVSHEDSASGGSFSLNQDGVRVAEMTYRRTGESRILIDHTWVDEHLRGKGLARILLDAAVVWARATGTRVSATCSYAVVQFARDSSIGDVRDAGQAPCRPAFSHNDRIA